MLIFHSSTEVIIGFDIVIDEDIIISSFSFMVLLVGWMTCYYAKKPMKREGQLSVKVTSTVKKPT